MKIIKFTRQILVEETFIQSMSLDPTKLSDVEIDGLFDKRCFFSNVSRKTLNTTDHDAVEIIPEFKSKYLDLAGQAMINKIINAPLKPGGEYEPENSKFALLKVELDEGFDAKIKKIVCYKGDSACSIELELEVLYKHSLLYKVDLIMPIYGLEDDLGLDIFYSSWKKLIFMMEEMDQSYRYPFGSDDTNNRYFTYYKVSKAYAMFKRGEDITTQEAFKIIDRFDRYTAETTGVW